MASVFSTDYTNNFQQFSNRFREPLECLTAYLLLESSEVLGGVKPANLVSLVNRVRPCGRNLYHLWQSHSMELPSRIPNLSFKILHNRERALLIFSYNPEQLHSHLAHPGIRELLKKAGYDTTQSSDSLLTELCERFEKSDIFPHEIGLFIGYPAKDVAAFMGLVRLPFTCQGPWKIFGNPTDSLKLADQHRCCRQKMAAILASGEHGALELHNPDHPFFCPTNDNNVHLHKGGHA